MPSQEKQRFTVIERVSNLRKSLVTHGAPRKTLWGVVVLAATIGMWFFSQSHFDVAAKPSWTRTQVPLIESQVPSVVYFPSQYVNQAKEDEPQPPTF